MIIGKAGLSYATQKRGKQTGQTGHGCMVFAVIYTVERCFGVSTMACWLDWLALDRARKWAKSVNERNRNGLACRMDCFGFVIMLSIFVDLVGQFGIIDIMIYFVLTRCWFHFNTYNWNNQLKMDFNQNPFLCDAIKLILISIDFCKFSGKDSEWEIRILWLRGAN